jgi:hypothetical protein
MKTDPIIEQVHRRRRATAKRFKNDLHAICQDARKRQAAGGRQGVRLPSRPILPFPAKSN